MGKEIPGQYGSIGLDPSITRATKVECVILVVHTDRDKRNGIEMCLGVPGKIIEINDDAFLRMGKVDFGGVAREVCLAYVPEAQLGDYVLVHVGFAINQIDEEEAHQTLALMQEAGILEEERG